MNQVPGWIYWAPLVAASLHIIEEFVFPGGFPEWDRRYRPGFRKTINPRFHIIINGLLLILCYDAWALRARPAGAALWLTVTALLATNGLWHAIGTVKSRSYSPGVATGLLLYVPLAIYGYARFLRTDQASPVTAIVALALGSSYQLWVGTALHKWRTRRAASAAGPAAGGA
jgi:hypothetical protein